MALVGTELFLSGGLYLAREHMMNRCLPSLSRPEPSWSSKIHNLIKIFLSHIFYPLTFILFTLVGILSLLSKKENEIKDEISQANIAGYIILPLYLALIICIALRSFFIIEPDSTSQQTLSVNHQGSDDGGEQREHLVNNVDPIEIQVLTKTPSSIEKMTQPKRSKNYGTMTSNTASHVEISLNPHRFLKNSVDQKSKSTKASGLTSRQFSK